VIKLSLRESLVLAEARDPDKRYKEIYAKNEVDRVILALTGTDSAVWTKLLRSYDRIQKLIERAKFKHEEKNKELRSRISELFDADDVFVTRVVETARFTAMLYKKARPDSTPKDPPTVTDWEAVARDLQKLLTDDLIPQAEAIIAAHTKLKKVNAEKAPNLKVEPKPDHSGPLEEGLGDAFTALKRAAQALLKQVTRWALGYDKKLAKLKARAGLVSSK